MYSLTLIKFVPKSNFVSINTCQKCFSSKATTYSISIEGFPKYASKKDLKTVLGDVKYSSGNVVIIQLSKYHNQLFA